MALKGISNSGDKDKYHSAATVNTEISCIVRVVLVQAFYQMYKDGTKAPQIRREKSLATSNGTTHIAT